MDIEMKQPVHHRHPQQANHEYWRCHLRSDHAGAGSEQTMCR